MALALPAIAAAQELSCPQFGAGDELSLPAPVDDKLHLSADKADITQDGLSTLAGTVRLVQGGNRIDAQALDYDRQAQTVKLSAESLFRNRDLIVRSRSAEFDLGNETGTFHGTEFTLVDRASRGAAETIRLAKAGTVNVDDVYYTTCPPGSRAWFLQASEIELDRNEGMGTAKHARLRFGDVPVLYFPWFTFPIDNRRRTGLLFPTVGRSDTTGFDAREPLYLNLAPNYDAQITPRYMSRRGTQVATEGRYLLSRGKGQVDYEYLDEDQVRGSRRTLFNFQHDGLLNKRLAFDARYGRVSDTAYFEDLGGKLDAASISFLERSAMLTYAAPATYTVMARVTDYQVVSQTALADLNCQAGGNPILCTAPYQRAPEIRIDALTRNARYGARAGMTGQFVNFVRDPGPQGQRLDLDPYLRFVNDQSAYYFASQLNYDFTRYVITDPVAGQADHPSRALPIFSAEGGLRFERLTVGGNLQTLEPRAFYLYVPFRDQSQLPRFDTGEPDFDFVQLFANNRFSGLDRIADANHVGLAFTSRLLDPADGTQRYSASVGQIFRFATPQVGVGEQGLSNPDKGGTDFIAELDYRVSDTFDFSTAGQWSPVRNEFVRGSSALRWRSDEAGRQRADLVYRYREAIPIVGTTTTVPLEQVDLSAASPLWGPVSALARWRYSLAEDRSLESLGGLEYETCCWAVRGAYRRYQFNTAQEYTSGVYFQLELKGLTRLGAGFQALLPPLD